MSAAGRVGIVAIGRDEGERLRRCLTSVLATGCPVIYVDSGSRDGSVAMAREMGATVVELDLSIKFTAARARDVGLRKLRALQPDVQFVQFIDGDCILAAWLPKALATIDSDQKIAGVCGRRREIRTAESFYSRITDIDWNIPAGEVPYFGGDALARISALDDVGGWDHTLIAGEEPDLCFRMRDKGWRIVRLPDEQTLHDVAMSRFGQYWRRSVRTGHAFLEVGWKNRHGAGRPWIRQALSALAYGLVFPTALIAAAFLPFPWNLATLLIALLYVRVFISITRYGRGRNTPLRLAMAYAAIEILCKPAYAIGVLKFLFNRLTNKHSTLIEYKAVTARSDA
jgi:glycosyltransferase involved in cell wall biosynthesis